MSVRRILATGLTVVVAVVAVSLVAGIVLGQPILLSYVETGSMAPTMEPGDGFVAVPTELAGGIEEGDVIVFDPEEINGGEPTTHRVVDETDRGYVTKGDANPFTDQDDGEPPVKDAQVLAEAVQVGDTVVTIPYLGTAVTASRAALEAVQRLLAATFGTGLFLGLEGVGILLFALSVLAYVLDVLLTGSGADGPDRSRPLDRDTGLSARRFVLGLALLLMVSATAAMVVPAGTEGFGIVSAEFDSERPAVIPAGTSADLPYHVPNEGIAPVYVYLEPASEGVAVEPERLSVGARATTEATVTVAAPEETGYYRRFVTEYRYLAFLPAPVVAELYAIHPWVPIVVIDALLGGGVYLVGMALLGRGRVRRRDRDRPDGSPSFVGLVRKLY